VKRLPWRAAIGVVLTVVLLWWAFHGVRWADVYRNVRQANVWLVLAAITAATLIFPLRAIRWRPILDPVVPKLGYGPLWRATAIGMMSMLPLGRGAELVRAYALSRQTPVPFSAAFASLVVDRVFDGFVILLLMVVAMMDGRFPAHTLILGRPASNWAGGGVFALAIVSLALYTIVFFPGQLIGLFEIFARRVAPRFEERGRAMLRSFADGLSVLRHPGRFFVVFWWTLLHWLMNAVAFWLMFKALDIDAPFSATLFIQGLIVFAVAIPATPGFFGPWELAAIAGLSLYGVDEARAAAWALGFHITSLIPITVIGLYYLARSGLHLRDVEKIER
jgi:glycosyltransferase 2 family protein